MDSLDEILVGIAKISAHFKAHPLLTVCIQYTQPLVLYSIRSILELPVHVVIPDRTNA